MAWRPPRPHDARVRSGRGISPTRSSSVIAGRTTRTGRRDPTSRRPAAASACFARVTSGRGRRSGMRSPSRPSSAAPPTGPRRSPSATASFISTTRRAGPRARSTACASPAPIGRKGRSWTPATRSSPASPSRSTPIHSAIPRPGVLRLADLRAQSRFVRPDLGRVAHRRGPLRRPPRRPLLALLQRRPVERCGLRRQCGRRRHGPRSVRGGRVRERPDGAAPDCRVPRPRSQLGREGARRRDRHDRLSRVGPAAHRAQNVRRAARLDRAGPPRFYLTARARRAYLRMALVP